MNQIAVGYGYHKSLATGRKLYYTTFREAGKPVRQGYPILKTATRALEYGQAVLLRLESLKKAEAK